MRKIRRKFFFLIILIILVFLLIGKVSAELCRNEFNEYHLCKKQYRQNDYSILLKEKNSYKSYHPEQYTEIKTYKSVYKKNYRKSLNYPYFKNIKIHSFYPERIYWDSQKVHWNGISPTERYYSFRDYNRPYYYYSRSHYYPNYYGWSWSF